MRERDESPPPSGPAGERQERPPASPPIDLAAADVPCRNCGFNLRGLSPDGTCPECGSPIWRSIRGELLVYAGADYLQSLSRGVHCILIAAVLYVAAMLLSIIAAGISLAMTSGGSSIAFASFDVVVAGLFLPISALMLYGWWLFSAADPGVLEGDRGDRPRRIVRVATVVLAATSLLGFLSQMFSLLTPDAEFVAAGASLVGGAAGIVQFFASVLYLRWLAPRFPSPPIERQAQQYLWLLPLIYILGACLVVGPLVATVMYFLLLNRVRLLLNGIRLQQAKEGAGWGEASPQDLAT